MGEHLRPGGFALLVLSDAGREGEFTGALEEGGWVCSVEAERDRVSEVFRIYRVSRPPAAKP